MATGIDMGTYTLQYTLFVVEVLPKKRFMCCQNVGGIYNIHMHKHDLML